MRSGWTDIIKASGICQIKAFVLATTGGQTEETQTGSEVETDEGTEPDEDKCRDLVKKWLQAEPLDFHWFPPLVFGSVAASCKSFPILRNKPVGLAWFRS